MDTFEPIRNSAAGLHDEVVSLGVDPLTPWGLVEALIRRLDLEVFWLAPGDPTLKGSRALFDEQSGSVYCEAVDDLGERALLTAHEIGHDRVHADFVIVQCRRH